MNYCSNCAAKENEKNLATQSLQYLKEKENSLKDFLQTAKGQLKNIEDSIQYTATAKRTGRKRFI